MRFTVVDVAQQSDAWARARAGRLTASRAADILATRRDKQEAAARRDYRLQLVCERLTGTPQDDEFRLPPHMVRGVELEAEAIAAYEAETGLLTTAVGFCQADDLPVGCSPDRIVGAFEGYVECKCPKTATHLRYLAEGVVPPAYVAQITCGLWVTGAPWADFISYDNRLPHPIQLFRVRVERDEAQIAAFAEKAQAFLEEVARDEIELRQLVAAAEAAA